mgnify:CR=1 FL=1
MDVERAYIFRYRAYFEMRFLNKLVYIFSFMSSLLLSFFIGIPLIYAPLITGGFMATLYFTMLGVIFFFDKIPNMRLRALEGFFIFLCFIPAVINPQFALAGFISALYIAFAPLYLGVKHGAFRDGIHGVLWFIATTLATAFLLYVSGMWASKYWVQISLFGNGAVGLVVNYLLRRWFIEEA